MRLDLEQLLKFLNAAGVAGLILLALIGFYKKWWYPPWYVDELREKRELKATLLELMAEMQAESARRDRGESG